MQLKEGILVYPSVLLYNRDEHRQQCDAMCGLASYVKPPNLQRVSSKMATSVYALL